MYSLLVLLGILLLYFLPAIIAFGRGNPNRWSVGVLNFFLGWTFVGWVVSLAMAASGAGAKRASGSLE